MSRTFRTVDRDMDFFLPPSIQEWLPQGHLARFVVEIVDELDLSPLLSRYKSNGGKEPYHPSMLLGLLFYGYATKIFSSREIEKATYDSIAFRFIAANQHPDHDTIAHFRKTHLKQIKNLFVQILSIAQKMEILKLGTVSLDGTKIAANASKHKALSYSYAEKLEKHIEAEVEVLLAQAEKSDENSDTTLNIPEEIKTRTARLETIREAIKEIEARAKERYNLEKQEFDEKMKVRADKEESTGKKSRGRPPQEPTDKPKSSDQVNLTDKESRIMPSSHGFVQAYNAQASVDNATHLIVATHVTQNTNDKREVAPALVEIKKTEFKLGEFVKNLLADTGFFSATNVHIFVDHHTTPYLCMAREKHNTWLSQQLKQRQELPALPQESSPLEEMEYRLKTPAGRALYAQRKSIVEPVFGIIKNVLNFRRFSLRGLENVTAEWSLVAMAFNIKRLHVLCA
jgi:transposase